MMNYGNYMSGLGLSMGVLGTWLGVFLLPLIVWSFVWKGWALWKAAKADSVVWFVVLMLVNTLGILEILYIFVFSKMGETQVKSVIKSKKASKRK
jgi:hypothetical protein